MAKLIWFGAWTSIVIWSLLCWAAFGLIDVASGLATGTSSIVTNVVPGTESLVRGLIDLADDVGELLLFLMWGGVSGLIFAGAWVLERALGTSTPRLYSGVPPPYASMGAEPPHYAPQQQASAANSEAARAIERLSQRGVKTLKRLPGQDKWQA